MHAIQLLKQQHAKVKAAFPEIEAAPAPQRGSLWARLGPELELHERMEETHLYRPVAREAQFDRSLTDWEAAHHGEVREAGRLIREIGRLDPSDDRWLQTVKKLKSALQHHIHEEEQYIWPKIERVWDAARLEEVGRQMQATKHDEAAA